MSAHHRFRWLPDDGICLVHYAGHYEVENIIRADEEIFAATLAANVRYLFDARDARGIVDSGLASDYLKWFEESKILATHPGMRQAVLVDGPATTAISLIVAKGMDPDAAFAVFSTVDAACDHLGVDPAWIENHRDLIAP